MHTQTKTKRNLIKLECGCHVCKTAYGDSHELLFCPMHKAASNMLDTLREVRSWLVAPDLSKSVIAAYQHDCDLAINNATQRTL